MSLFLQLSLRDDSEMLLEFLSPSSRLTKEFYRVYPSDHIDFFFPVLCGLRERCGLFSTVKDFSEGASSSLQPLPSCRILPRITRSPTTCLSPLDALLFAGLHLPFISLFSNLTSPEARSPNNGLCQILFPPSATPFSPGAYAPFKGSFDLFLFSGLFLPPSFIRKPNERFLIPSLKSVCGVLNKPVKILPFS